MDLIKAMKERIAKSGANKKEILYFGKDAVKRIRFLQELDKGFQFQFHNDWSAGIFELCKDPEDHENCKLCEDGIGLQDNFVWSVWDYDSGSVRLLQFKATGVTPVPAFIEMFEEFGTITDRDYKVKKVGQGQGGSFVVTPLDKERFKNSKAKPYTYKQVKEIMEKAWVSKDLDTDDEDEDEEEDDEVDTKKKASKGKGKKKKKEPTLREKFEELSFKDLKSIALEIGMTKKELKAFDDEEELLDELFDNYEEEDLQELLDDMDSDDEEEDEDEA